MNNNLSFITNEENQSLRDRFRTLIKDSSCFDCLVGYFYSSGFHAVYPALENTDKVRILIGISTNRQTWDMMEQASGQHQQTFTFSHAETKREFNDLVESEMAESEDSSDVENGVRTFIEWIERGKLEIRAYPSQRIHAKLYIMTFGESDRDTGRVITGSSNFTQSGLVENLEFNVELQRPEDYHFALKKFNELWDDSVDVGERYIETVQNRTWLARNISPYHLYLKFLYEYFKDELNQLGEVSTKFLPQNFKKLEYQEQAVLNAKKILLEYGGVFIADVVGLGKTYISAMLAGQLNGRILVIAPPVLLEESNPGSWRNVFSDFKIPADFQSLGKLDNLLRLGTEKYDNIIIDEAHRFRTEMTATYEKLAEICRGKRVILVTATPYNNTPRDILSLLKLFQKSKKSTIPNLPNLEAFFARLNKKVKDLDRKTDYNEYIKTVKDNAQEIRNKVLKYLMVRRTRTDIERYFKKDITQQGLKFPQVEKPTPLFYKLNNTEDAIFNKTIDKIAQQFKYARYMPMLYYKGTVTQLERQSQRNMGRFMKILLIKRLESSFFAFRNSVDRFLHSYEMFLKELDKGWVYVSAKHINKIFELLEHDDDNAIQTIQKLIDDDKAEKYESKEFRSDLRKDLEHDLKILKEIQELWQQVERDPKLLRFQKELQHNPILKDNHLIIFTESKETANYLYKHTNERYPGTALLFTGDSKEPVRDRVIENFDANARHKKNDHRILISTEVLSEGVNLHRANVVINYDIPWNPTRMMQRVGRINRVDTSFDVIHTFNFFPTVQSNDQIKLKEAAEGKISAFLTLLGGDAALLTEGEPVDTHELFDRMTSRKTLEGDDEAEENELKYLHAIRNIRENDPDLFETIKRLPRKARTAKADATNPNALITYFRRGKVQKFFMAQTEHDAQELDFMTAASILESEHNTKGQAMPSHIYSLLTRNKEAFVIATTEEMAEHHRSIDSGSKLLQVVKVHLKNPQKLTEDQEDYLRKVAVQIEEGGLPRQTTRKAYEAVQKLDHEMVNALKVLAALQRHIPERLLHSHYAEQNPTTFGKREVILSLYLTGE